MNTSRFNEPADEVLVYRGRIAALDGLRGLAILMVLFHHLWPYIWESPLYKALSTLKHVGWIGVDLFFVLSGFLITGILLDSRSQNGYFRNFLARRSLRVFPLYFFFLFLSFTVIPLVVKWLAGGETVVQNNQAILPWFVTYAANFLYFFQDPTVAHWFNFSITGMENGIAEYLAVTWSLCVEEQFYLLWPVLIFCAGQKSLRIVGAVLLLGLFSRALVIANLQSWQQITYMTTFCRVDSLSIGAAIAIYIRSAAFSSRSWNVFVWFATLVVLPASVAWIAMGAGRSDKLFSLVGYTLVGFGFAGVLGLTLSKKPSLARKALENRWLQWFGKYSYGIYLYHMVVLTCVDTWRPAHTLPDGSVAEPAHFQPFGGSLFTDAPLRTLLVLVTTMAIAWLSFRFLESPFLKLKGSFEYRPSSVKATCQR